MTGLLTGSLKPLEEFKRPSYNSLPTEGIIDLQPNIALKSPDLQRIIHTWIVFQIYVCALKGNSTSGDMNMYWKWVINVVE